MSIQNISVWEYPTLSTPKAILRFVFTWLVTLAIFVVLFSRIPFHDVVSLLQQTDMRFLCASLLCSVLAIIVLLGKISTCCQMMGCRISFGEAWSSEWAATPSKAFSRLKWGNSRFWAIWKKDIIFLTPGDFLRCYRVTCSVSRRWFSSAQWVVYFMFILRFKKCSLPLPVCWSFYWLQYQSGKNFFRPGVLYIHKMLRLPENVRKIIESYDPQTGQEIMIHSLAVEGCKLLIILFSFKSLFIDLPVDALLLWGSMTIIAAYLPMTYWGLGIRESAVIVLFRRLCRSGSLAGRGPSDDFCWRFASGFAWTSFLLNLFWIIGWEAWWGNNLYAERKYVGNALLNDIVHGIHEKV